MSLVEQCQRENCCTFVHTGLIALIEGQKFYTCTSCQDAGRFGENEGICEICAKLCHGDHKLVDTGGAHDYCHCGVKGCDATKLAATMCPGCSLPLSRNSKFCFNCGQSMAKGGGGGSRGTVSESKKKPGGGGGGNVCSNCGERLGPQERFCNACGEQAREEEFGQKLDDQESKRLGLMDMTPQTTELKFEGVFMDVYKRLKDEGRDMKIQWVVRNKKEFNPVSFTFDFEGCKGIVLNGPTKQTKIVPPATTMKVAEIWSADPAKGYALSVGFGYALQKKDDAAVKRHNEKELKDLHAIEAKLKAMGINKSSPIPTINEACQKLGSKFVDLDFPPEMTSVFKGKNNPLPYKEVVWQRPDAFMPSVNLFEGIDPTDINQGTLGNCWFCCALSSLAEFPKLVKALFDKDSQKANPYGCYRLRFYNETDLEPILITVDDFFPCIPGGGPVFTHNKGNEIWVLLIEKAYAKLMDCYYNLKSGMPGDAFSDFTGCPVQAFSFEERKIKQKIADGSFWNELVRWDKRNCIMAAGKYGEDKFSEHGLHPSEKGGLVPGHAYSLIEAKEGCGVRLVRLRNPWGQFEWKGAYCDSDARWTPDKIAHFKPVFADDDGMFWMEYKTFLANFDNIEVCYAEDERGADWYQKRFKGRFMGDFPYYAEHFYEIDIHTDTNIFFSIFQPDQRIPGAPVCVEVGVLCATADGHLAVSTDVQAKNRVCGEGYLSPGKHYVIPFTAGCRFRQHTYSTHSFVFSIHADNSEAIKLRPVPADGKLLAKARIDWLRQHGTKQVWNGHSVFSHVDANLSSFGIEAAADKKADTEFTLDFNGSTNVFSAFGSLKVTKRLKPGECAIIQDLAVADSEKTMQLKYGIQAKSYG